MYCLFEKAGETSATQCFYGRRTDWEKFYKIAETYLTSAVNNSWYYSFAG